MEREVMALVWLYEQGQLSDAELIVRIARPSRWEGARFAGGDVERAARAIERDSAYRTQVSTDAVRTVEAAGCGLNVLTSAFGRLIEACREAS